MKAPQTVPEGARTPQIKTIVLSVTEIKQTVKKAIERLEQQTKSKRKGEKSNES